MKRTLFKTILGLVLLLPLVPKAQQNIASQFSFALSDSTQLKLTATQIASLQASQKLLADSIGLVQAYPDSIHFYRPAFESRTMNTILTNKQYTKMLTLKNKPVADAEAQAKWDAIVAKLEDDLFTKDSTLPKLAAHILLTKNIHDRYAHSKVANDSASRTNHFPDAVYALASGTAFWGTAPKAKLTQILKDRKTYGLSEIQVQQLLAADRHLQRRMDSVRRHQDTTYFSWVQFDNTCLQSILTPAQLNQLMQVRHQDEAKKVALQKWTTAVANNATGNYDQQTATQQLTNYYLQYNTLQDLYGRKSKVKDSTINAMNKQMPDSFQVLVAGSRLWGIDTAGLIGLALKYCQNLGLRKTLADSLAVQGRWEKRQEKLALKYRDSLQFSRTAYEIAYLPTVLTDTQYYSLLIIKELPIAQKNAQNHWKELTKYGLTANLNQDSTIGRAASFFLTRSVTADRLVNDVNHKKAALTGLDVAIMPESLRLLNQAKKGGNKGTDGVYVW